jgi:hypothetical protein
MYPSKDSRFPHPDSIPHAQNSPFRFLEPIPSPRSDPLPCHVAPTPRGAPTVCDQGCARGLRRSLVFLTQTFVWSGTRSSSIPSLRFTAPPRNHFQCMPAVRGSRQLVVDCTDSHPHPRNRPLSTGLQILESRNWKSLTCLENSSTWSRGVTSVAGCSSPSKIRPLRSRKSDSCDRRCPPYCCPPTGPLALS